MDLRAIKEALDQSNIQGAEGYMDEESRGRIKVLEMRRRKIILYREE